MNIMNELMNGDSENSDNDIDRNDENSDNDNAN